MSRTKLSGEVAAFASEVEAVVEYLDGVKPGLGTRMLAELSDTVENWHQAGKLRELDKLDPKGSADRHAAIDAALRRTRVRK